MKEIYLTFGATLKGESKSPGRDGWMDIDTWNFEVKQGERPVKEDKKEISPVFSAIKVEKEVDRASPNLMLACATGKLFAEVTIEVCKTGDKGARHKSKAYLTIKLSQVHIVEYEVNQSAEYPRDNFKLHYLKIRYSYQEQAPDGSLSGGAVDTDYTLTEKDARAQDGGSARQWELEQRDAERAERTGQSQKGPNR